MKQNLNDYKKRFNILLESTLGDVKPLISEQVLKDFSKEIFDELKSNGFSIKNPDSKYVELSKSNFSLFFEQKTDSQNIKYYRLDNIKYMLRIDINVNKISPDLLKTFYGADARGIYVGAPYHKATAEDKEYAKTLSRKDRNMMASLGPTEEDPSFYMWTSQLEDLELTTLGQSKETTSIYKYMKDFYEMATTAQKYQDFNSANFAGQVKIVGQDLKAAAAPLVDKAKQGIQNLASKVKSKIQQ